MSLLTALSSSGKVSRLAVWFEDSVQVLAQRDDLIGIAGKPGMHPSRALEKGLRRPIRTSNADTQHQPTRVNETYFVEQSSRRGKSDRNRT